jgi:phage/plasmid-like protein (TIGR03299 family)
MSHEISILENGLAEAMFASKPAWHGLGQVFDGAPDSATAARLSGLDQWTVSKEPLYNRFRGEFQAVPEKFNIVRSDNGRVLGQVGKTYVPFQNWEAFAFLDSLVMDGILRYESAFAMRGGEIISLLARLPGVDHYAEGDVGLRYILLSAGHDGQTPIGFLPTSVRVVCANTRRMALQSGKKIIYSIKHTAKMEGGLLKAKQYISQFDAAFTLYREQAALLATRQVSPSQVVEYLESLDKTLSSKLPDGTLKDGRALSLRDNKVGEIRKFALNPANTLRSVEGTWWGLFNAVTMAIDHGEKFTSRGATDDDGRAFQENKFLSLMDGGLATLKDTAFVRACEMAGIAV